MESTLVSARIPQAKKEAGGKSARFARSEHFRSHQ